MTRFPLAPICLTLAGLLLVLQLFCCWTFHYVNPDQSWRLSLVQGNAKVARAKNDGYTLLVTHVGMATTPVLYRKLSYNYETDFEYLGMINDVPMTLIGKPQLEANNFKELQT